MDSYKEIETAPPSTDLIFSCHRSGLNSDYEAIFRANYTYWLLIFKKLEHKPVKLIEGNAPTFSPSGAQLKWHVNVSSEFVLL